MNRIEKSIDEVFAKWERMKRVMEENIIPSLKAGVALEKDDIEKVRINSFAYDLDTLKRHTDAKERARHSCSSCRICVTDTALTLDLNKQCDYCSGRQERPKPVYRKTYYDRNQDNAQEYANEWLKEICEEHGFDLKLLEDEDTETFTLTTTEKMIEYRSGEIEVTAPDRIKELYEAIDDSHNFDDDFGDHMKEGIGDSFEIEMEGCGDYDTEDYECEWI